MAINDKMCCKEVDRLLRLGRYADAEARCRQLLEDHAESLELDDLSVVTMMQKLAQALSGQKKYVEALETKLSSQNLMISLMRPT